MFEEDAICVRGCGVNLDAVCDDTCPLGKRTLVRIDLLVRKHYPKLVRFAMSLGNTKEEAEDIVQDAFVRAYRSFPRFRGTSVALVHWLYKIAVNLSIDASNREKRKHCLSFEVVSDLPDTNTSPEDHAFASLKTERIYAALDQLPETYSLALRMRLNDFSYEEIASLCGVPLGTVKSRIHKAHQMLRHLVKENQDAL
jgi:RNA polymerase sigma-70 factor (ECF subfamily)